MRLLLALVLVLCAAPAWALQPVYVDQQGAKPDGVVLTTCSMTATSAVLTCTGAKFAPADVGKSIGVYGAKTANGGYAQVLATTIASRQSLTQVTLALVANVTVNPSTRVVYGTDNTVVLQRIIDTTVAAPDGRGRNVGGQVLFGAGHYLVKTLSMPCSRIGTFNGGGDVCSRAYNNIALRGAGQQATILENWDPAQTTAVLVLGAFTRLPDVFADGNDVLAGITLADLTVRQVLSAPSTETKAISSLTLADSLIERVTVTGSSYECLYVMGWRLTIRQNYASGCGIGGPGYTSPTSAYNILTCVDCLFTENTFDMALGGAQYGFEGVIRGGIIQGNRFTCTDHGIGFEFGSTNRGIYDVAVLANVFHQCGINFGNGNGTANRLVVKHNIFVNGWLTVGAGVEQQLDASWGSADAVVHGPSVIDGNLFLIDGALTLAPEPLGITIFTGGSGYGGQESYSVTGNTQVVRQTYCTVAPRTKCQQTADCASGVCAIPSGLIFINQNFGSGRWTPSTACTAGTTTATYAFPVVYNGYYYRCTTAGTTAATEPTWCTTAACTTSDGTAVWTLAGRKPHLWIANNSIQGPESRTLDYVSAENAEISLRSDADRDSIFITNFTANYPWKLQSQNALNMPNLNEIIPAGAAYGDLNRFLGALPTLGYYQIQTLINHTAPGVGARGWVATRAGRAGAAWAATTAYGFAAWVVPTADNAHAYTQRTGAGCTSSGSQPTWPTGAGATVTDGTCVWKESGAAVLWLQF